jgi:hypothetical protein
MATDGKDELIAFHRFLGNELASGAETLPPEEYLELWRAQNPRNDQLREDVEAVQQALADMEAGDTGKSLKEFCSRFRERNEFPA